MFFSPLTHRVPEVYPKYTNEYTPKYTPEYTPELKTRPHDYGNDTFMLFEGIFDVIWYYFNIILMLFDVILMLF